MFIMEVVVCNGVVDSVKVRGVCNVSDQLRGSVSSLLQTVARDEDMSWARREQQALGRVPSRGGRRTELSGSYSLL